jgi:hypothetical protein
LFDANGDVTSRKIKTAGSAMPPSGQTTHAAHIARLRKLESLGLASER